MCSLVHLQKPLSQKTNKQKTPLSKGGVHIITVIPILEMWKLRLGENKYLVQGHTVIKKTGFQFRAVVILCTLEPREGCRGQVKRVEPD